MHLPVLQAIAPRTEDEHLYSGTGVWMSVKIAQQMAGGDFDGDVASFCFWKALVGSIEPAAEYSLITDAQSNCHFPRLGLYYMPENYMAQKISQPICGATTREAGGRKPSIPRAKRKNNSSCNQSIADNWGLLVSTRATAIHRIRAG